MQTQPSTQSSSWSLAPGGLVRVLQHGATPRVFASYVTTPHNKARPQSSDWYRARCRAARAQRALRE
jgi:hypothetical protein